VELPRRLTRIVATLGPASLEEGVVRRMVGAGMDVARLNASHADHAFFRRAVEEVRSAAAAASREVAILLDLRGPKIRVGELADSAGMDLAEGDTVTLTTEAVAGADGLIPCTYQGLARDLFAGDEVLLDDGAMKLEITERLDNARLRAKVVEGGRLLPHKGINVPGRALSTPALVQDDLRDLEAGLRLGVDYVALSFVRRPEDLHLLRGHIERLGGRAAVVAKIEKPQALDHLEEILEASDGVMVARGDLGVEVALERVPQLQKEIIHSANRRGVLVITATQMLESMIEHHRPTRAEASDVANAIFDGSDAVMLSGETAVGRYPVEAVGMMDRIAREAEDSRFYHDREVGVDHPRGFGPVERAMAWSARRVATEAQVRMIVVYTLSGRTARVLSKLRPRLPVIAFCPDERICRQMALFHGVVPLRSTFTDNTDSLLQEGDRLLLERGLVQAGEKVVVLGGTMQIPGATNLLQIRKVGAPPVEPQL